MESNEPTLLDSYYLSRQVPETLIQRIASYPEQARSIVLVLIEELAPSANQLRDILSLFEEICGRDQISFSELADRIDIVSAIRNDKNSRKQRLVRIRDTLSELRFPALAEIRQSLDSCCASILENHGIRVEYPHDLEGDSLNVSLKFKTQAELEELARGLLEVSRSSELKQVYSLLLGQEE